MVMLAVVAQRLMRRLCPHCKQEAKLDEGIWNQLIHPYKAERPERIYQAVGCTECRHTGYLGRTGIYEMMSYSAEIQRIVTRGGGLHELRRQALKEGMRALRLAGAQKVAEGITTIEEVLRVTPQPLEE